MGAELPAAADTDLVWARHVAACGVCLLRASVPRHITHSCARCAPHTLLHPMHRYEQHDSTAGANNEDGRALAQRLASFSGVGLDDLAAVRRLVFEAADSLREQPVYICGEVALLRVVQYPSPNMEWMRRILDARRALNSDAKVALSRTDNARSVATQR